MLSGLLGSGFGLLGLTEATSNAAVGDMAAGGAAGSCADVAVAASRIANVNPHVKRILFMSIFPSFKRVRLKADTTSHVWRMRLSDQGARTLAISGSSAGDTAEMAFIADIPSSCTPAICSTVSHAAPNAAEIATAPLA